MAQTYAKFYLDRGGIVREMILKDEELKFYINHEKVDIDTYTKIMVNEFPEMEPFLLQLKKDTEPEPEVVKEPQYIEVSFQEGIIHGYHYGEVIVVDEDGDQIDFDFEDSELSYMLPYVRKGCSWFIPTSEYKKHKGVDY